jgi:hypothetical protein
MPSYIEGYCEPQMPPPYEFKNVRIWCFPLLADLALVQAVVDKYLKSQSGLELDFSPIQGTTVTTQGMTLVYLTILDYGHMACLGPGLKWGPMTQKELYFGIWLVHQNDLYLFTPYIFVDNPWSLVCGNTVIGYPKQMAWFQMPPGAGYPIRVDAPVFTSKSPSTPLTWQRLVNVQALAGAGPPAAQVQDQLWPFGDVDALFGQGGVLPVDDTTFSFFADNRARHYRTIQLKQFRLASSSTEACYRSRVTSRATLDQVHDGGLLPPAAVDLASYASVPISQTLGLASQGGRLRPLVPFWLRCSFKLTDVTESAVETA